MIRGSLNFCPFGLPITRGCKCAGGIARGTEVSAISLMTPFENDLENKDEIIKDNLEALSQIEESVKCPYADSIYQNNKVDCKFDINNKGIISHQLPLTGSPEYPAIMIGNSSTPGFSYPTHEYSDNNNRSIYYGIYSLIG